MEIKKTYSKKNTIREILMEFLKRDLAVVKKKKILEIGCGKWNFAKKILEKNGCDWHGFEPVDMGKENITIIKGSVKNIPYHDNIFDLVLCNQTIEHWFEYNVSLKRALSEINRVLKPGGIVMINGPMHHHGDPRFLRGELQKIVANFDKKLWKIELVERVFPKKHLQNWKRLSGKGFLSKVGYPDFIIPDAKNARTHQLNIHAKKKKQNIKSSKNRIAFRYFAVILRFAKVLVKTRFSN